jgi:hypothetical protein
LHEEKRALGADLARGEAGGEIGGAPGDGAGQAEDFGERNIHCAEWLAFFGLQAEDGHDFLQIFPDFGLGGGIAEQVGGMIGGH